MNGIPSQRSPLGITKDETSFSFASPMSSAPTMPSEERVMRAREVLAEALDNHGDRSAARGVRNGSIELGCMAAIDAMLAFSDEGSGIGALRRVRTMLFDEHAPLLQIAQVIDAALSSSPDIDRSGLAQEAE